MMKLLLHNKKKLQNYIDLFDGKTLMVCTFQKVVYWQQSWRTGSVKVL